MCDSQLVLGNQNDINKPNQTKPKKCIFFNLGKNSFYFYRHYEIRYEIIASSSLNCFNG